MPDVPRPTGIRTGAGTMAMLALAVLSGVPASAGAQSLSREEALKEVREISARSKADQALCNKQPGAERRQCISLAKSRERSERAEVEARARPAAASVQGNIRDGRATVAPGQYGHVARDGSAVVGNRQALPAGSAAAVRSADELNKGKLPSNQPVDVKQAARAVQGTRP